MAFSIHLVIYAYLQGLFGALMYCQLHISCALEIAVDMYCVRFFDDRYLPSGIMEWNVLQAMLRRSARTVEMCFLALNTAVLGLLMLTGVQVVDSGLEVVLDPREPGGQIAALWCAWVLPPVGLVFFTVFSAAAVTEKCNRVPSLVNSWHFGESEPDRDRPYIVQHIAQSAAGFYVKGVRLSTVVPMKLTYLFGLLAFTLLSRSILRN